MRIVIDARLFGPKNTGNGIYTQNLIENLVNLDSQNSYFILLRKNIFEKVNFKENFQKILTDFKHYSFAEQIFLPFLLYRLKPDLVHFTHFNVPIFYFGKFIVTIHDLTMHKFKGGQTTTSSAFKYILFRIGYYISFFKAIYFSEKIIVPTKYVKSEILEYYKVLEDKIIVIYE